MAKLTRLAVVETSAVDHPAHLHEGWLVAKATDQADVDAALAQLTKEDTVADDTAAEVVQPDPKTDEPDLAAQLAAANTRIAELEAEKAAKDEPVDEVAKALNDAPQALRDTITALQKQADDTAAALQKERDDRADADAVVKATGMFKHLTLDPAVVGPALRRLSVADPALHKAVSEALASADAQNESAGIFSELGKAGAGQSNSDKVDTLAKALVSEGKAATYEQAVAAVVTADPSLYDPKGV